MDGVVLIAFEDLADSRHLCLKWCFIAVASFPAISTRLLEVLEIGVFEEISERIAGDQKEAVNLIGHLLGLLHIPAQVEPMSFAFFLDRKRVVGRMGDVPIMSKPIPVNAISTARFGFDWTLFRHVNFWTRFGPVSDVSRWVNI